MAIKDKLNEIKPEIPHKSLKDHVIYKHGPAVYNHSSIIPHHLIYRDIRKLNNINSSVLGDRARTISVRHNCCQTSSPDLI